jgi:hypothetical protein
MAIKPPRIKVKETTRYWDEEGSLEKIISSLQSYLEKGWEGLEIEYERDYGDCDAHRVPYLYKYREETDKEYEKRVEQLEKVKTEAKKNKLQQLKKDLDSLSAADKKLLGL